MKWCQCYTLQFNNAVCMSVCNIVTSLDAIPAISTNFERSYLHISCYTDENEKVQNASIAK